VKFILNILYVSILGIYGLNQAVIFKREDIYLKIRDSEEAEKDNIFETSKEGENKIGEEGGVKKEPFKLSLEQRIKLMERIDKMMVEKKSYRNPQLSIYDIAEEMFTNIKYISLTINSIKKMNFYAYISSYRINEAIELFKTKPELSIPEIMEESGFYSRSSFNEYFHKKTGLSPSEFRKKAQIPGNQQNIII
jgi:AraC-like DNA-binding protein